eukprot:CAMPEP_0182852362 /NCGR_PEP_ID=MMETSP0034_2-20130328/119_1 /TAXON_ID=156128 /ORGANISM="Nephroselmis pyriformis, Strain CCMP717" /LENGTH=430 /DNA_ID=CAMNT_0024983067 /DNA_START=11 /DNA_END=1303 /DNA_ORIENTATION=+
MISAVKCGLACGLPARKAGSLRISSPRASLRSSPLRRHVPLPMPSAASRLPPAMAVETTAEAAAEENAPASSSWPGAPPTSSWPNREARFDSLSRVRIAKEDESNYVAEVDNDDVLGTMMTGLLNTPTPLQSPFFFAVMMCALLAVFATEGLGMDIGVSLDAHTVIGSGLFLILGFKTNSCYDKWWEARGLWGNCTDTTRSLAMLCACVIDEPAIKDEVMRKIILYAYSVKAHLRFDKLDDEDTNQLCSQREQNVINAQSHAPNFVLMSLRQTIYAGIPAGDGALDVVEGHLTELTKMAGGCERILKTPFPIAFETQLLWSLVLWLVTLPFPLANIIGVWTIPGMAMVAYILLGLESAGRQIENPFGDDFSDLPLGVYCQEIRQNVCEVGANAARWGLQEEEDKGKGLGAGGRRNPGIHFARPGGSSGTY